MFGMHLVRCLYPHNYGKNEWQFLTGQLVVPDSKQVPLFVLFPFSLLVFFFLCGERRMLSRS